MRATAARLLEHREEVRRARGGLTTPRPVLIARPRVAASQSLPSPPASGPEMAAAAAAAAAAPACAGDCQTLPTSGSSQEAAAGGVPKALAAGTRPPTAKPWNVSPSVVGASTRNPIRMVAHNFKAKPNPDKELIRLTLGDPTMHGLRPAEKVCNAVMKAFSSGKYHGYAEARGLKEGREAVAAYYDCPDAPVTAEDVTIALGTSEALDHVLAALANPGENVLVPNPGYIYCTMCANRGIATKPYALLPDQGWRIDVAHLEAQIDDKTKAIVVNSPSNPCGSLVHKDELEAVLDVAERHRLPIISDEVYEYMVFKGETFYPTAKLSKGVPVFTVSGLSKRFLCPGWRIGWIVTHDKGKVLPPTIREALIALAEVALGPSCFIQAALPEILADLPTESFQESMELFERNAYHVARILAEAPGLRPVMPQGSMFMMIGIECIHFKDVASDMEFAEKLMSEESVFCMPSACFQCPGYVRIVLAPSESTMVEACERMLDFTRRHSKDSRCDV